MTETTRPNLQAYGEEGSRVWYRDSDTVRELPLRRVRKVSTRIGDDAKVQGAFKLAAAKMTVEQIHNSPDITDQSFEPVNRPGVLINIDGQQSGSIHGSELVLATVDKVSEKVIDKTTVDREITARGAWSRVIGKTGSTPIYQDILLSDVIRRVLEAIDVPYGVIEDTPNITLDYFWLSDRQDATAVLLGLVEAAGAQARLDDYEGVIRFSREPSEEDRLIIYGGVNIDGFSDASEAVTGRTTEGTGVHSGGTGIVPNSARYGGFPPFQATLGYRYDPINDRRWWFVQPYTMFTYNSNEFCVELMRSGYDSTKNRYYIEISIVSEDINAPFTATTFRVGGQNPAYVNWQLGNTRYLRKRLSGTGNWDNLSVRATDLASVPTTTAGNWLFESNEVQGASQHKGRYRFEVTRAIAESAGLFTFGVMRDRDAVFSTIQPPSESERLIFSDWKRNDDDSRYFNSISVPSITRAFDEADSDIWESPETISVLANASLTIRISSDDGTPFRLATTPFTYAANANLSSITADRQSGSEISVTITAGGSDLELEDLVVRGRFFVPVLEQAVAKSDNDSILADGDIPWEPGGTFPEGLSTDYLSSWIDARLQVGLERRWTTTLDFFGWDPGEGGYIRNNWQTLMRLRPGRLVQIIHGRNEWLGLVREIERTSGSAVDHVDRYRVTCELSSLTAFATDILRVGLSNYGSDEVLG